MDCPICQTSNIPESNKCCPTCGYNLSPDFTEQQRIAWAKKLWADSQAKTAEAKPASTQSRFQINQIVSQVEQLTQVQTQLSNQLTELVSANMSVRFSEIEQRLEQRLEDLDLYQSASKKMSVRLSEIEQELKQRRQEIVDSRLASANMSARLSEIEQKLEQRLEDLAASRSASDKISDSEQELEQELKQRLEEIVTFRSALDQMSARFSEIQQELKQPLKTIDASRKSSDKMSARLSEIQQELQQRRDEIILSQSQLPDLSEIIDLQIIDKLRKSLSEELSTAVSQLEQQLDSLVTVSPQPESTTSATPQPSAPDIGITLQTFSFTTVKVSDKGEMINPEQLQGEYFSEDMGNGVTLDMVAIPGGTFMMGSPESEEGRDDSEGPQHRVTVPAFFMGKYPVTQQQWQAVMGNNPSKFQGANRPVERVSWNEAVEFCQKLSQKTGRDYRLPSEAEWEYACRAGTTTPFYFGETITTDLANYDGDYTYGNGTKGVYRGETTDVGSFPPNAFGLYDMHGNVLEWCADHWHDHYNGAPTDGSAWTSGGDSDSRLLRGGYWYDLPRYCRSACRYCDSPGGRYFNIGFRFAVSLPRTP